MVSPAAPAALRVPLLAMATQLSACRAPGSCRVVVAAAENQVSKRVCGVALCFFFSLCLYGVTRLRGSPGTATGVLLSRPVE
jgi:hypothetical protein